MESDQQIYLSTNEQFTEIWKNMYAQLSRRALRLNHGNNEQADDLLAKTALKTYLYLCSSPEKIYNLAGFLFFVLEQLFLDGLRQNKREGKIIDRKISIDNEAVLSISSEFNSQEKCLELHQQFEKLDLEIARLNPEMRRLFELRFEQELSYKEISNILQISQPLARKRIELIRKKITNSI